MRMIFIWLNVLLLTATPLAGQVLTTIPEVPVSEGTVSIRFDTSQEPGELNGYTGRLFAHTGVNLSDGSNWQYVIGSWASNSTQPEFQYIGFNTYNLTLSPDLYTYYGVPPEKEITGIAIVIRSEDGNLQTQDYFIDIFPEGLQINVISPTEDVTILELNDSLEVVAAANNADTISLYQNGVFVKGTNSDRIEHIFYGQNYGENEIVIRASNVSEETADTLNYFVRPEPIVEALPVGVFDGINYISDTSVILCFYAPGKEHIFALGDFSGWIARDAFYMKKTPDGERFWCRIDTLEPGQTYRFYYLVDGNLRVPDPYTELLVDPWNDRWISEETFPGIGALISGLEDIHYSVIQPGREPYVWSVTDFTPPAEQDLVIYEMLLRDFLAAHDWKTLTDTLDYLTNLGINAIEVMPFNEFVGNESWGYNPIYFYAPDKYYGPPEDLKRFVDSCHARGIAVIQDIVFNHIEWASPQASLYTDPGNHYYPSADNPWLNEDMDPDDPNGSYQARHPYSVFFDFDHSSVHTQRLVDRTTRYWMEEFGIDGFRFDLSKGLTQRITYLGTDPEGNALYNEQLAAAYDAERIFYLKRIADSIWAFNENAYVILEHFCDNTEEKELSAYGMMLWGNSNYNYNEATMGYTGNSNFSWISYKNRGWADPHVVGYMESHDEERLMYKNLTFGNASGNYNIQDLNTALHRMELAGVFFFTIPGPKLIWQFGELGYDYSINEGGRMSNKPIRWDYFDQVNRRKLYEVWSSLIGLRIREPAFKSADFNLFLFGAGKQIAINHDDMDVRIIGNFDVEALNLSPVFSRTGWWYDYFSGDSINVTDVNLSFSLEPGGYRIFTTKKLTQPEIPVGMGDRRFVRDAYQVYPNPVNDLLYMEPLSETATLTVIDMEGRRIMAMKLAEGEDRLDLSSLPSGIYILSRHNLSGMVDRVKIVKQ